MVECLEISLGIAGVNYQDEELAGERRLRVRNFVLQPLTDRILVVHRERFQIHLLQGVD